MIDLFSKEAEVALLGLILKDQKLINHVLGSLNVFDFYFDENKKVFSAILKVVESNKKIDSINVVDFLEEEKEKDRNDWFDFLGDLIFNAGIKINLQDYINTIKEKSQARVLEKTLKDSTQIVSERQRPVQEIIEEIENKIFNITKDRELKDFKDIDEITSEFVTKLENFNTKIDENLVTTGIDNLDKLIVGFRPGDLVILAARPSMGKTAVSLEFVRNISKSKKVGYFSIEMPSEQLVMRMLSAISLLEEKEIKNINSLNDRQKTQLKIAAEQLKKLNIYIDDSHSLKLPELLWKTRKLKSLDKLDVLVIDYLQLINTDGLGEQRYHAISAISRGLKQLARELQIPIIALAQLSRSSEKREDKRPLLSDIRDSGNIEQDADVILMLYREQYQNKLVVPLKIENLEIIVSKHRNGPTGVAFTNFEPAIGKITSKKISNF